MSNTAYHYTPQKSAPHDFMQFGNCLGVDPELFFPERGDSTSEAKAVCAGCEVTAECLKYALAAPAEKFGIWGGMSERERRQIRVKVHGNKHGRHGSFARARSGCTCEKCLAA